MFKYISSSLNHYFGYYSDNISDEPVIINIERTKKREEKNVKNLCKKINNLVEMQKEQEDYIKRLLDITVSHMKKNKLSVREKKIIDDVRLAEISKRQVARLASNSLDYLEPILI